MLQCKRIARAYFSKNREETLNRCRGPPPHSNPICAAFPHATTDTGSRQRAVGSPAQLRFLAASEPHIPVASGTVIPILRHDCSCRPQVLKCLRMQISSDRDAETAILPVKSKIGRDQGKVLFGNVPEVLALACGGKATGSSRSHLSHVTTTCRPPSPTGVPQTPWGQRRRHPCKACGAEMTQCIRMSSLKFC